MQKYEILQNYFGLNGICLDQPSKDPNKKKINNRILREKMYQNGHIYREDDYAGISNVIRILKNENGDKRSEEDEKVLTNLLSNIHFFKHGLHDSGREVDLKIMTQYIKYVRVEPGDAVFK
jgi:hypothetical protein